MAAAHDPTPTPAAARRTARLMVLGQFLLLGLIVGLPGRHDWTPPATIRRACVVAAVAGVVVMVVGTSALGRGLTAAPLPNEHAKLRTSGLYRYVRHPIYTGLLLFAIAYSLRSGSSWVAATCGLLIVLINVKARWEEHHLAQRFPNYATYTHHTPRFIPVRRRPTKMLRPFTSQAADHLARTPTGSRHAGAPPRTRRRYRPSSQPRDPNS